jgi:uncharacterized glyoxalase superfamily protein PhnB
VTADIAGIPAVRVKPLDAPVSLVSMFCADHQALATWYKRTLGFDEISVLTTPLFIALAAGPRAVGFHQDEAYDLLGVPGDRQPRGTRIHLVFDVGDATAVDAALPTLLAHGAVIVRKPFTTYYGARQIVFRDPEGNMMRLSSSQTALHVSEGPDGG